MGEKEITILVRTQILPQILPQTARIQIKTST